MKTLIFRAPGVPLTLLELLGRAWERSTEGQRRAAIHEGRVRVDRVIYANPDSVLPAGARVQASVERGEGPLSVAPVEVVAQGVDWSVVVKPAGVASHEQEAGEVSGRHLAAAVLGLGVEEVLPVHRLDSAVGGAWLLAHGRAAAARLGAAFEAQGVSKVYQAWTPALELEGARAVEPVEEREALSLLRRLESQGRLERWALEPWTGRTHQLRRHMAGLGAAILGDPLYGGVQITGGLRLWSWQLSVPSEGLHVEVTPPPGFAVVEEVYAAKPERLTVSQASVDALKRGHPWVLPDGEMSEAGRAGVGAIVGVQTAEGPVQARVIIEGPGKIAARLWWWGGGKDVPDADGRVKRAFRGRREAMEAATARGDTGLRLIHGEADGLPGLTVDRLGSMWRVTSTSPVTLAFRAQVIEALLRRAGELLPTPEAVVEVLQHPWRAPLEELKDARVVSGAWTSPWSEVQEGGVIFRARSGLGGASGGIGYDLAGREVRARLRDAARSRRWLVFEDGGAAASSLVAGGASQVLTCDPDEGALAATLRRSGLEARRVRGLEVEGTWRGLLARLEAERERFDGIFVQLDSLAGGLQPADRQELEELLGRLAGRLTPGAVLGVVRAGAGDGRLKAQLDRAGRGHRPGIEEVEALRPPSDLPLLKGFPEGDALEGAWMTLRR